LNFSVLDGICADWSFFLKYNKEQKKETLEKRGKSGRTSQFLAT
jgi:hypothetical protein